MSLLEWNTEEAKEAWFEEGMEEGLEEVARNALTEGFPVKTVQKITGLNTETIQNIRVGT